MKLITAQQINALHISPKECVDWIRHSFMSKYEAQLPTKISLHPQGNDFFNTMPCLLPPTYHRYGVKIVSRIQGAVPSLCSDILLYDSATGELLAMLDGDWITTMRTGAVATVAMQTLRKSDAETYAFVGLGNTGRASLLCLLEAEPEQMHKVLLFRYKDQAELFIERFSGYDNVEFTVVDDLEEMISKADVIVSCITDAASSLMCADNSKFKEGCLVIPVHTRGFQNCDLFFDKVFADDTGHVCGFKYFSQFKQFAELSEVLLGQKPGRENDKERILSYNIGLGLHDVFFANRIYTILAEDAEEIAVIRENKKFWI